MPLGRPFRPRHRQRKRRGQPDVVSHSSRQQAACPFAERRRPGVLPCPARDCAHGDIPISPAYRRRRRQGWPPLRLYRTNSPVDTANAALLCWHDRRSNVRAVTFKGTGGNEVVSLAERPDPVPGSHEIVVAAPFAAVQWADGAQRQGNYPPPAGAPQDIPGLEVAGVVAAVGEGVLTWRVGDRAFGIVGGGGPTGRVAAHGRAVARIPPTLADHSAPAVHQGHLPAADPVLTP